MADRLKWRLSREIGIARPTSDFWSPSLLRRPVVVQQLQGSERLLILDRFQADNRIFTLEAGNLREFAIIGLLCPTRYIRSITPADNGRMVVVAGNAPREIVLIDNQGRVVSKIYDSRQPHALNWPGFAVAADNQLLVGDQPTTHEGKRVPAGLVLLRHDGSTIWEWRPGDEVFADANHITVVPAHGFVITDTESHQVLLIDWDWKVRWRFGERGCPGADRSHLCTPFCTTLTPSGTLLIADTRNDRLVEISLHGQVLNLLDSARDESGARLGPFCDPESAFETEEGSIVVADTGNGRVISVRRTGEVRRILGPTAIPRRLLSYPRSIEQVASRCWLVADTNNNRVIELTEDNRVLWQYGAGMPKPDCQLRWPRCARRLRNGYTVIADSLNARVLVVTRDGELIKEYHEVLLPSGQRVKFADPHDAWLTNSGNLLLVDSGLDLVAEISPSGEALWALGGPTDNGTLRDPHRAVRTSFGHLLLADSTGILTLDKRGRVVNRTGTFVSDTGHAIRLTRPKALLDTPTTTIIADPRVGEHDLIGLIKARGVAYEVLNLDGGEQFPSASDICTLHQPRWLALSQEKRVVISDYSGHRLIETIPSPKTV